MNNPKSQGHKAPAPTTEVTVNSGPPWKILIGFVIVFAACIVYGFFS